MNILIGYVVGIYEEVNANCLKTNKEIISGMKTVLPELLKEAQEHAKKIEEWEKKNGILTAKQTSQVAPAP